MIILRRKKPSVYVVATLFVLMLLGIVGGVLFVYLGLYNVSALKQHTQPVYAVVDKALRASISQRAEEINAPPLDGFDWQGEGLRLHRDNCVQCHGAPGVAPEAFALGMTPVPAANARMARERSVSELYWVINHGIKMTGMPPWKYRLSERQMWSVVAFIKQSAYLSAEDYQKLVASLDTPESSGGAAASPARASTGETPEERGSLAVQQYGCVTCHAIPGITGAAAHVGPPLGGIANRAFIAGVLPNTRENMIHWIRSPQEIDPLSAMPGLGVTEEDAENMASFLATLKDKRP
ncbi:c-type cytochrome [Pseudomonas profundi]|uniref:c-type cytochrome n=1 Tax=Pseudomonas profundi TaxID=1981513 RepID=UPI0012399D51|nr:c-type cytochrome [Pseudomonas profundi]